MTVIRREIASDAAAIERVLCAAFPSHGEARLVEALRVSGKLRVSLVALTEGEIVGYVAFSPATLDPPNDLVRLLGLAPVAVHPTFQRRTVGSLLVERGLEECRGLSVDAVVVLGEPEFYSRFGFRRASALGLGNEYGADEAFMVTELRTDCLANTSAIVRYAPEFALV